MKSSYFLFEKMQNKTARSFTPDEVAMAQKNYPRLPGVSNTLVYMPKVEKAMMDTRVKKNRRGKAKYAVLYEVQKVIKATSPEQAKEYGLDDSMELVDSRRFKSVNPRRRQKQTLPAMLAPGEFRMKDKTNVRQQFAPVKNLSQPWSNTNQKLMQDDEQPTSTSRIDQRLRHRRMSLANKGETNEHHTPQIGTKKFQTGGSPRFKTMPKTATPKNPQQEAVARQREILDKIKKVPNTMSMRARKKLVDGRLFVLNDNSASRLGHHHATLNDPIHRRPRNNSSMSVHTKQPSALSNRKRIELLQESSQSQEKMGPPEQGVVRTETAGDDYSSEQQLMMQYRRASVPIPMASLATGSGVREPRNYLEELMPRILVSEDGGCVNLINEGRSEFSTTNASAAINYTTIGGGVKRGTAGYTSRRQRGSTRGGGEKQDESWSRQQLTTAGTVPSRGQPEHSQYLVELMRPFASRAGVQGLGVKNNTQRAAPMSSQEPHRLHQYGGSGGPPLSPLIGTRINKRRPINTRCQHSKPTMVAAGLICQSDENPDLVSSLDTKRSPFRQQPSIDQESSSGALNKIKEPAHDDGNSNIVTCNFARLQSGTGTLATLPQESSQMGEAESQRALCAKRKYSVFTTSAMLSKQDSFGAVDNSYCEDELPYMTDNSRFLQMQGQMKSQVEPRTMRDRVRLLPLKVKQELQVTRANQLFEFYEAVLQPSITPFTQLPEVASQTPKIGDKVSMLSSVRETLTKRYQLALAAKTEAHHRLIIVEKLKELRSFIENRITFRPSKPGDIDIQSLLLSKVSYREPDLVDCDISQLMTEIYEVGAQSQRLAAALTIQNWARMAVRRAQFKRAMHGLRLCQRQWRYSKFRKFLREAKAMLKLQSVKLLQRQLRGYLAYNRYFAKLKGNMTQKNLDYIIHRYADAKEFMLECLQIKLAYLARKLIKKRAHEKELRRLAAIAEKKRIADEKERERLRKIFEQRKQKKRMVKQMVLEAIEISYAKDDKRRDDAYAKEKKKAGMNPAVKAKFEKTKWDLPLESVHYLFKQELFDNCYKNIKKRIVAKKKGKNKDLNISTKNNSNNASTFNVTKAAAVANKDRSVSPASPSKTAPGRGQQDKSKDAAVGIAALLASEGPSLDPHHVHIYMEDRKFKVAKFDKHPDPKKRRKETVTFEVTQDCMVKEQEKYVDPFFKMEIGPAGTDRSNSSMVAGSKNAALNINVPSPLGTPTEPNSSITMMSVAAPVEDKERRTNMTLKGRRTVDISGMTSQNSLDDRDGVVGNDDLSAVDSVEAGSNSGDDLSNNSETYDFLMVYMPQIRPKALEPEDEVVEELKRGPTRRGSKLTPQNSVVVKGNLKRQKTINIKEEPKVHMALPQNAIGGPKLPPEAPQPVASPVSEAENVIQQLKIRELDDGLEGGPKILAKKNSSTHGDAVVQKQELAVVAEEGTKAAAVRKVCEMKIEVQGSQPSRMSENQEDPTLMPPKLAFEGSQHSYETFKQRSGGLRSEESRKMLRAHILEEQRINDDSESITVSHLRSKLASGEGTIASGEYQTINSVKSQPKLIEETQVNDTTDEQGMCMVDVKQTIGARVAESKSTTTLMTNLGAYYHTASRTIFQHDPDQETVHISAPASSAVAESPAKLSNQGSHLGDSSQLSVDLTQE